MMYADSRSACESARARFAEEYQVKYPRAVASLNTNWERLTAFFAFPAEHWNHLRTTNVIESAFATVRSRERATRGAGSRTKGLLMAFKLLEMASNAGGVSTALTCCRWCARVRSLSTEFAPNPSARLLTTKNYI
jgi:transposase-like protein